MAIFQGYLQQIITGLCALSLDYLKPAHPQQILHGHRIFQPFMKYQTAWLQEFYPGHELEPTQSSWFYLQKYMMPLIQRHASSYHVRGIEALQLANVMQPDFEIFSKRFAEVADGFTIAEVDYEIDAFEYFTLIYNQQFPCIKTMRPLSGLFCTNIPDFWHEAIGHIAPLCFKEVQQFYLAAAEYMLAALNKKEFHRRLAVAWPLLEYGFIKEADIYKMFGAALVGSHLANMRYQTGLIAVEDASLDEILQSGFYRESFFPLPRNAEGKLRFFSLSQFPVFLM